MILFKDIRAQHARLTAHHKDSSRNYINNCTTKDNMIIRNKTKLKGVFTFLDVEYMLYLPISNVRTDGPKRIISGGGHLRQ